MNLATLLLLSMLSASPAASTDPLCVKRAPCKLTETLDAGSDAQGEALRVKHLSLGWANTDLVQEGSKFGKDQGREAEGDRNDGKCKADEWWLVRAGSPPQLLLATCNGGYGAAGVGEDEVTVTPNRLVHTQSGGSADRWTTSLTLQLSPLARLAESRRSINVNNLGDGQSGYDWDFQKFQGTRFVPVPGCGEPAEDEDKPAQKSPARNSYAQDNLTLPLLPRVDLDKAWLQEGWKQTALGSCALTANQFTLGKANSPEDAALKVLLASQDTLVLEVRDDHWTGPSDKWLADDHVELWLDASPPERLNACTKPSAEDLPKQWAIRIADNKVFPAHGSPKGTLGVEKVELREAGALVGYRLKIQLPRKFEGLGVLYSDSDSGKTQERLLATSPLKFARPETLNPVRRVASTEATCVAREGALEVQPTLIKPAGPNSAVLPSSVDLE